MNAVVEVYRGDHTERVTLRRGEAVAADEVVKVELLEHRTEGVLARVHHDEPRYFWAETMSLSPGQLVLLDETYSLRLVGLKAPEGAPGPSVDGGAPSFGASTPPPSRPAPDAQLWGEGSR